MKQNLKSCNSQRFTSLQHIIVQINIYVTKAAFVLGVNDFQKILYTQQHVGVHM